MTRPTLVRRTAHPASLLAIGVLLAGLTACGDDEPEAGDEPKEQSAAASADVADVAEEDRSDGGGTDGDGAAGDDGDGAEAASGPITVENLAARCDELTAIVTTLRGEAPAEVEPSEVTGASYNGYRVRTAHCTYAYADDSFSDKNRVDIYLESAPGDPVGMKARWDEISAKERIPGIGDEASWFYQDAFDAKSSARALVGTEIVSVRITVPTDQADAAYLEKAPAVTALKAVVAKL